MSDNNDGFVLVKSKKKQNKIFKKAHKSRDFNNIKADEAEVDELINKIKYLKNQLISHDHELYTSKFLYNLDNILGKYFSKYSDNTNNKIIVCCYGLGSFEDSLTSRYQLALLLIIIDYLKKNFEVVINKIFDPLFNSIDMNVIEKILDYKYSNFNSKCMQTIEIDSNCMTLIFMPHCPKALYNNFLFANWTKAHLESVLIVGNSFRTIKSLNNEEDFAKNYRFLNESIKFVNEHPIESKCDHTNAFHDLSLVMFQPNETENLSINFYGEDFDLKSLSEPVYDKNEEII